MLDEFSGRSSKSRLVNTEQKRKQLNINTRKKRSVF